ncbi:MAG: glycosyltransferase [Vicinamibacterales bacterium]
MTADPELPVPPRLYGGIERIIDLLVTGLVDQGHDVTLIAHVDSVVPARLVPYPGRTSRGAFETFSHAALVARTARRFKPDVIQSFSRVAYLLPVLPDRVPKVMSYQREVTASSVRLASRLARGSITWTACSGYLANTVSNLAKWRVIHNAVSLGRYNFANEVPADAPLVFLGRIEHIKGTHIAIDVARRAGRRLVIAGNVPDDDQSRAYFRTQIAPHVDQTHVSYVGAVDDAQKSQLLSTAAAFLMPVLWDEPFGIVMAEALACGTPVIGLERGAVGEVVEHGRTGWVCSDADDMVAAVARIGELSRRACREAAAARFSAPVLVDAYEALYREIVAPAREPTQAREVADAR